MCATAPPRILVVDDEEAIRFAVGEYFTTAGYLVDVASELADARALLDRTMYAVVIADLRLSEPAGTEGLEVVSYARERCPATRIIVFTAYGSPAMEREARRRGVDAFLQKPQPLPEIARIVSDLAPSSEAEGCTR